MAFSLSSAAAHEIRARLRQSTVDRPVASLHDVAPAPSALAEAIETAESVDRIALAQEEFARLRDKLQFRLGVGVYSSTECRPQDLVEVDGVALVMPKEMLEFFASCSLEYEDGAFSLRKGTQEFASLNDFANASTNAA